MAAMLIGPEAAEYEANRLVHAKRANLSVVGGN
jgi:hypothetical protein